MKKIGIALLLIFILAVILVVINFLNQPSKQMTAAEKEAAIAKLLGRKPNLTTSDAPTGDKEYKGKYISFMYPEAATTKKQLLNGEEIPYTGLELFIFGLENPKLTTYVEVIEAPQNVLSINDYPAVKLRQIQANIYEQKDVFIGNTQGLVFDKKSNMGFEKTAFFLVDKKVYSFSIQSPDSKTIEELFNNIIASAKFL